MRANCVLPVVEGEQPGTADVDRLSLIGRDTGGSHSSFKAGGRVC